MDPKHKRIILSRWCDGEWHGAYEDGKPVITLDDVRQDVTPFLAQLGLELKKQTKYTEKKHADMGKAEHTEHSEDSGDGVSQSEE